MAHIKTISKEQKKFTFLKKWATPASCVYFRLFKQTLQFLQKNVYPVYGAGIQTHDLHNMTLLQ